MSGAIISDKQMADKQTQGGVLYVVATPIGNLEDITLRALRVLGHVDLILAEDTRVSHRLLRRFAITTPMKALHEHNEQKMAPWVVDRLHEGMSIALISDAGTPSLRDPGFHLTRALRMQGKKVVPIPGPSALVCALSAAGLPADRFVFEGFLPVKQEARRRRLQALVEDPRTLVVYEAPHRILMTVRDMVGILGDRRQAVIARELTKAFETLYSGSLPMIERWLEQDRNHQRGEFVLVIEGKPKADPEGEHGTMAEESITEEDRRVLHLLMEELPLKKAVILAARLTGRKKNALYRIALRG
uniref:Ribosomal RNA small subunit methyltransferase I n=1 Tax=Candidatus Kentrum eta TaxID=2126337 RepID=A0A450V6L0_9GAMM|nr:MAG: 16S rRNA (cytidine1402-2'-O)-methyltransferase [Candidatus Kentron sp. H]VFJ93278.1 MAG: 16S rRNA (cytidine1402-2'-O)-methyltransferase [Candidatus Kentron sp. H]VFK00434.1 MAG: 16S rRNA (cytidine1402-2'-O)-methyltransferase [Candidatus Kentron sp. H]